MSVHARRVRRALAAAALLLAGMVIVGGRDAGAAGNRPLRWPQATGGIGEGVAYGPYRDGQHPGGPAPTREQLREDVRLLARHWQVVRLYGSLGPAEMLLPVIAAEAPELRVVLGIWLAPEERRDSTGRVVERFAAARAANRREIAAGIRLANAHPEIVLAISVGNETQVGWSAHRLPGAALRRALREVRSRTRVPVTTADDHAWWRTPASAAIAREVDFVLVHAHPLWNGRSLAEALEWTRDTRAQVQAAHPGLAVVIGETGWATAHLGAGEQGRLIRGETGEEPQARFHTAYRDWCRRERVMAFVFEAFDENWKGGPDAGDVEKHWGLFRADRTPKPALRAGAQR